MKPRIRVVARIRDDVADARQAADQSLGLRLSARWPGVIVKRTGRPGASITA